MAAEFWHNLPPSFSSPSLNQHTNSLPSHSNLILDWLKPAKGWRKLNTDGSQKQSNISIGGILRSDLGIWMLGFGKYIGCGIPLLAEAWALLLDSTLLYTSTSGKLRLSLTLRNFMIQLVTGLEPSSHHLQSLIDDCRCLIYKFDCSKTAKICRNQNKCANKLAKLAREQKWKTKTFAFPPLWIEDLYLSDLHNSQPLFCILFFCCSFMISFFFSCFQCLFFVN